MKLEPRENTGKFLLRQEGAKIRDIGSLRALMPTRTT